MVPDNNRGQRRFKNRVVNKVKNSDSYTTTLYDDFTHLYSQPEITVVNDLTRINITLELQDL